MVVVLGADVVMMKTFLQLFSLGLSSVLGKFSRNFIHATVKAAFLVFLSLCFSLKRSIISTEAEKVDE